MADEALRALPNYGGAEQYAGRSRCLAEALAMGIPRARIDAFLAANPGDECRIASALAPNPGPGGVVTPIYASAPASYSPVTAPAAVLPTPEELYRKLVLPPASVPTIVTNADPLLPYTTFPVGTPGSPVECFRAPCPGFPIEVRPPGTVVPASPAPVTYPVGGVTSAPPAGAAPAPVVSAAVLPSGSPMMPLAAAAVVLYLVAR